MKGNDRIIFGIGLVALALLLFGIFPNIGLTYDSHLYLRLSENLTELGFAQSSFGSKPPLYPILLWVLQNNLLLISIFNVACWTASMVLVHKLLIRKIKNDFYQISFAAIVLFSTPVFMVHNFVWTESVFMALVLGFLYLQVHRQSNPRINAGLSILLLVGMVALKHLGIGLVLGFALVSFWKEKSLRKALLYIPAILFFILWQLKSYSIRGDLSRLDHSTGLDLSQNLNWIGQTLIHWFEPVTVPGFASIGFCILTFSFLLYELRLEKAEHRYFEVIPIVLLLIVATKADLLQADMERYFALLYPFLFFLIFRELSHQSWSNKIWTVIPVLFFVAYSVFRTIKNVWFWHGT